MVMYMGTLEDFQSLAPTLLVFAIITFFFVQIVTSILGPYFGFQTIKAGPFMVLVFYMAGAVAVMGGAMSIGLHYFTPKRGLEELKLRKDMIKWSLFVAGICFIIAYILPIVTGSSLFVVVDTSLQPFAVVPIP